MDDEAHAAPGNGSWCEATITINGIALTTGQSLVVRVALGSFALSLRSGLGEDEHGVAMTRAYQGRVREIMQLIHEGKSA